MGPPRGRARAAPQAQAQAELQVLAPGGLGPGDTRRLHYGARLRQGRVQAAWQAGLTAGPGRPPLGEVPRHPEPGHSHCPAAAGEAAAEGGVREQRRSHGPGHHGAAGLQAGHTAAAEPVGLPDAGQRHSADGGPAAVAVGRPGAAGSLQAEAQAHGCQEAGPPGQAGAPPAGPWEPLAVQRPRAAPRRAGRQASQWP